MKKKLGLFLLLSVTAVRASEPTQFDSESEFKDIDSDVVVALQQFADKVKAANDAQRMAEQELEKSKVELRNLRSMHEQQLSTIEELLAGAEAEKKQLTGQAERDKKEIASLRDEMRQYADRIGSLEASIASQKEAIRTSKQTLAEQAEALTEAESLRSILNKETAAKEKLQKRAAEVEAILKKNVAAIEENASLKRTITDLNKQICARDIKIIGMQNEIETLKQNMEGISSGVLLCRAGLEQSVLDQSACRLSLADELGTVDSGLRTACLQSDTTGKIAALDAKIADLTGSIQGLERQLGDSTSVKSSLEEMNAKLQAELLGVTQANEDLKREKADLEHKFFETKRELGQTSRLLRVADCKAIGLEADIKMLERRISDAERLERAKIAEKKHRISELEAEVEKLSRQVIEKSKWIMHYSLEVDQLRAHADEKQRLVIQCDSLQRDITALQTQIKALTEMDTNNQKLITQLRVSGSSEAALKAEVAELKKQLILMKSELDVARWHGSLACKERDQATADEASRRREIVDLEKEVRLSGLRVAHLQKENDECWEKRKRDELLIGNMKEQLFTQDSKFRDEISKLISKVTELTAAAQRYQTDAQEVKSLRDIKARIVTLLRGCPDFEQRAAIMVSTIDERIALLDSQRKEKDAERQTLEQQQGGSLLGRALAVVGKELGSEFLGAGVLASGASAVLQGRSARSRTQQIDILTEEVAALSAEIDMFNITKDMVGTVSAMQAEFAAAGRRS